MVSNRLIEAFRRRAKQLYKELQAGQAEAEARYDAVWRDRSVNRAGLMRCQRVVAREAGYANWGDLLHAPEGELRDRLAPAAGENVR